MLVLQEMHTMENFLKYINDIKLFNQSHEEYKEIDVNLLKTDHELYPHYHVSIKLEKSVKFTTWKTLYFAPAVPKQYRIDKKKGVTRITPYIARKFCTGKQVSILELFLFSFCLMSACFCFYLIV